ncbi:unnamed protein product [Vitrella brassicaformis CCMP3155]|uniref:FAS1 domain-containing protein n=2 Tax=Vitrella brassicaformis TaxID=1169539 RepID=A0A0G4EE30_VITBC|nr:unnamed protein product [Vitrella brassicaformis CCMP3155]|mmetsp:Transcript_49132/g.123155  ORF Transcript_49132/g.123155 Transcript_49132/m.123155 type:complete len:845 (+) Transcript_49132:154-2688(+)|eukprot:CEL93594.1 unnamed protein product [Vitrella brassicaformis CCMP3155]
MAARLSLLLLSCLLALTALPFTVCQEATSPPAADDSDSAASVGSPGAGAADKSVDQVLADLKKDEEAKAAEGDDEETPLPSGPMPENCTTSGVQYIGQLVTDFVPLYKEERTCQQACQSHPACYFFSFYHGLDGELVNVQEGDEIELAVPDYEEEEELDRRALAFADFDDVSKRRFRGLQGKMPTADEVMLNPKAGACFLLGAYVRKEMKAKFVSGPRTCASECVKMYSDNCLATRCCSRATATCVSKDTFFAQCRLPTDACPGKGWNCYNISSMPSGCLEYDMEYAPQSFANDIDEILDVETELHCQELCKQHDKCNYWSYNPYYKKMCLLKKKNKPKMHVKGVISGVKDCAGFEQPNLIDYIAEQPEYKEFYKRVELAGLDSFLNTNTSAAKGNSTGFTVFIPVNQAWENLDPKVKEEIEADKFKLGTIIKGHIVERPVGVERYLGEETVKGLKTASGETIAVSRRASNEGKMQINDANVLIPDIKAKDGMITTIAKVLLPVEMMDEAMPSIDEDDSASLLDMAPEEEEEEDEESTEEKDTLISSSLPDTPTTGTKKTNATTGSSKLPSISSGSNTTTTKTVTNTTTAGSGSTPSTKTTKTTNTTLSTGNSTASTLIGSAAPKKPANDTLATSKKSTDDSLSSSSLEDDAYGSSSTGLLDEHDIAATATTRDTSSVSSTNRTAVVEVNTPGPSADEEAGASPRIEDFYDTTSTSDDSSMQEGTADSSFQPGQPAETSEIEHHATETEESDAAAGSSPKLTAPTVEELHEAASKSSSQGGSGGVLGLPVWLEIMMLVVIVGLAVVGGVAAFVLKQRRKEEEGPTPTRRPVRIEYTHGGNHSSS